MARRWENEFARWAALPAAELLAELVTQFGDRAAIGTSFQKTGLAIIDLAMQCVPDARVFTIDTGRLFPETLAYLQTIRARYRLRLEVFASAATDVAGFIAPDESWETQLVVKPHLRQQCCYARKILPRNRALRNVDVWIAGIRQDQSAFRRTCQKIATVIIEGRPIIKVLPLFDWTEAAVDDYLQSRHVPLHPLYAQGYQTIGCRFPCTTPSVPGEAARAGRWRWEADAARECGFHLDV